MPARQWYRPAEASGRHRVATDGHSMELGVVSALSRRKQGFETPTGRQQNQRLTPSRAPTAQHMPDIQTSTPVDAASRWRESSPIQAPSSLRTENPRRCKRISAFHSKGALRNSTRRSRKSEARSWPSSTPRGELVESRTARVKATATVPAPSDEDGLRREQNLVSALRGMTEEQRTVLRSDAQWDDEVAGAVLRNNPAALGMSKSEWSHWRFLWQRKKFPDLNDRVDRYTRATGYADRAVPVFDLYIEKKAKSLAGGRC